MPKKRQPKPIPNEQNEPEQFTEWLFDFIHERNYKSLRNYVNPRILSEYGIFEALCQIEDYDFDHYQVMNDFLKMCVKYTHQYDYSVVITEAVYALLKNKNSQFSYSGYTGKTYLFSKLLVFNFDIQQFIEDLNNNYFEDEMNNDHYFLQTLYDCIHNSMHRKSISFFKPANWKLTNTNSLQRFFEDGWISKMPSSIFLKTNDTNGRNFYDNCLIDLSFCSPTFIHTKHAIPKIELILDECLNRIMNNTSSYQLVINDVNKFKNFNFVDFETELLFYYSVKNKYLTTLRDNVAIVKSKNKNELNSKTEITQIQLYKGLLNYVNLIETEIKKLKSELRIEFDKYCPIIIPDLQNIILRFLF
jgi:hypothetical protein